MDEGNLSFLGATGGHDRLGELRIIAVLCLDVYFQVSFAAREGDEKGRAGGVAEGTDEKATN